MRTPSESHLLCKDHFYKSPINFRNIADYEPDNEIDSSSIGKKTTNIYEQNAVLHGYHLISELDAVLKIA